MRAKASEWQEQKIKEGNDVKYGKRRVRGERSDHAGFYLSRNKGFVIFHAHIHKLR